MYIPLISGESNLFTSLHCLLKRVYWIFAEYIQLWGQNFIVTPFPSTGVTVCSFSSSFLSFVPGSFPLSAHGSLLSEGCLMESHKLIALQTGKHNGLYPLLSISLTVPPLVDRALSAVRRSLLRLFLCLGLSLLRIS